MITATEIAIQHVAITDKKKIWLDEDLDKARRKRQNKKRRKQQGGMVQRSERNHSRKEDRPGKRLWTRWTWKETLRKHGKSSDGDKVPNRGNEVLIYNVQWDK